MKLLLALACVVLGCGSPDAPDLSAEEQAMWNGDGEDPDTEVIEVEGDFDPNWEGPDQGAPANTNPGEPSGGGGGGGGNGGGEVGPGGGGGGGGAGEPEPIPERKICRKEMGEEACLDCCMWNHLHVDTPKCAEVPRRKRRKCREEATKILANCQVHGCDRHGIPPIITIVAPQ